MRATGVGLTDHGAADELMRKLPADFDSMKAAWAISGRMSVSEILSGMRKFAVKTPRIRISKNDKPSDRLQGNAYSAIYGNAGRQMNVKCYRCGRNGHFKRDCPSGGHANGNRGSRDFGEVKCFKCGKKGHFANCMQEEEVRRKRTEMCQLW